MADFITTSLSSSDVKQAIEKGPQAIAHAAVFGLGEQFATKGIVGRVLPGVGLINPALGFAEPIVSEIKRQIAQNVFQPFTGEPVVALNKVDDTGSQKGPIARVVGTTIHRVKGGFRLPQPGEPEGFKPETFPPPPVGPPVGRSHLPRVEDTPALTASIDTRLAEARQTTQEAKFSERRQVLRSNPMATKTRVFDEAVVEGGFETKVEDAADKGQSQSKANQGGFAFRTPRETPTSVLGFTDKDTASATPLDAREPIGNVKSSVFHEALKPQISKEARLKQKFTQSRPLILPLTDGGTASNSAKNPESFAFSGGPRAQEVSDLNRIPSNVANRSKDQGLEKFFSGKTSVLNTQQPPRRVNLGRQDFPRRRPLTEEFLQQHRFIIYDAKDVGGGPTPDGLSVFEWEDGHEVRTLAAGFSSCDAPSMELVTNVIKEGTWEFPREIVTGLNPGRLVLQKGMVRTETAFYLWIRDFLRGQITRRTLKILAYGRQASGAPDSGWWNAEGLRTGSRGHRGIYAEWTLFNCAPMRYSAGQGWDARSGEIQIAEMEINYERFEEEAPTDLRHLRPAPV